jgi:hypothetical protein
MRRRKSFDVAKDPPPCGLPWPREGQRRTKRSRTKFTPLAITQKAVCPVPLQVTECGRRGGLIKGLRG